jgi:endonuclease-3
MTTKVAPIPAVELRDPPKILKKKDQIQLSELFIERMKAIDPNPRCELFYKTHFHLLVSVVLSAQTTDKMVNRCMEPIYKKGFTPQDAVDLGPNGILKIIRQVGLAPTKSKNVFKLSTILLERHKGKVPNNREALEALPGVGRKTANVILGELFHHPTLAVDTHVYRVTKRLGFHREATAEKCEKVILGVIDQKHLPAAHHWLILHGRYTCTAKKPACHSCVMNDVCPSLKKPLS